MTSTQATAAEIREGLTPPGGVWTKRSISEKIVKRLQREAPRCAQRGDISKEAEEYLLNWSQGLLPRLPRPAHYPILDYHWDGSRPSSRPGAWIPPRRMRTFDLVLEAEQSSNSDSNSEGDIDEGEIRMPLANAAD